MTQWELPVIASAAELADRFELSHGQLLWLSDLRGLERTAQREQLRNYRYRLLERREGLPRVVEIPKARLKEIQRRILREILDQVPVHDAVHGFERGRSVISHAALHSGQEMLLTLDLADFFSSVRVSRVAAIFRALGYRADVGRQLAGLCTNIVPLSVWSEVQAQGSDAQASDGRRFRLGRLLASPHLPQGAPTSPALANLAAFALDRRLSGLAECHGLRYSRYADDLTFSGQRLSPAGRRYCVAMVVEIARDEGFEVNAQKTRCHPSGGRQTICGVVVNRHPNLTRTEYDTLAAIIHNAVVHGPAGQNRAGVLDFQAHQRGSIAWLSALNPARGERLRARFQEIDWNQNPQL
jgi:RNA-directed DNA polymerase